MTMTDTTDSAAQAKTDGHPFVPAALLRALGALVDPDATHEACRTVHLTPRTIHSPLAGEPDIKATIVEAIEGRVFVRATYRASQIDEGVLVGHDTTTRFLADEYVELDGRTIVKPFRLDLVDDLAGDGRDDYPDLDPLVPKSDQRLLFSIAAKEMIRALRAMVACGCSDVDVLQPEYRGGPLGLRGFGSGAVIEACIMPRLPFQTKALAEGDAVGQVLFDFRDVGDELVRREQERREYEESSEAAPVTPEALDETTARKVKKAIQRRSSKKKGK